MRFDLSKSKEKSKSIGRKPFKLSRGILKFKKTDSSEINEADEISRFENINRIYESAKKISSNFSSEKEIPELEKLSVFDGIFWVSQEPVSLRDTAQFGVQDS